MMVRLNKKYFGIFWLILVTEVAIAVFYFHRFIRGFIGDVLVIPLLYTFLRSFFKLDLKKSLMGIILFAFVIEFVQYFEVLDHLEISNILIRTLLGTAFELTDLLAYIIGATVVFFLESIKTTYENN